MTTRFVRYTPLALTLFLALGGVFLAGHATRLRADAKAPTYEEDVLPVLKQHCVACHGSDKQKGGLNVATFPALMEGGSSGVVVVGGDPDKSRLFALSAHKEEPKMPPSGSKMPDAQLATLKLWIEQGGREKSGSPATVAAKPKTEIGLKSLVKGRPEGPPPMPAPGKLSLEPVVQARRPGTVLALATSPWAPLAAIGGQKQVLLYNTDTRALLGVLPYEHGLVNVVKFSRNGKLLLVAGGRGGHSGKAVLFNVETGAKVTELGNEVDAILAADLSADQTQVAVGGPGKIVRIYATADGSVLREIKKHTDWVTALEFSPDGVLLATGDRNGGLFVWEAFTGREFFTLPGHTAAVTDLSWRDDANLLASASEDGGVRLWEMENGNSIKNWTAHGGGTASVRFGHDNRLATTGRDRLTKTWDQNGAVQKQFEPFADLGLRVAWTHDNHRVLAGDWGGAVKLWSAADAAIIGPLDANPPPRAVQVKQAETAVLAAEAKVKAASDTMTVAQTRVKTLTEAFNAAQAAAAKVAADHAATQKSLAEITNTLNTVKATAEPARVQAEKTTAAALAANATLLGKDVAAKAFAEVLARIDAEAKKAPQNAELAAQLKRVQDLAKSTAEELALAQKSAIETGNASKAAAEKHAQVQKALADLTAAATAAGQTLAALQAKLKPSADAVASAKAAMEQATAALAPARSVVETAMRELQSAKATMDALKASPPRG